MLRMYSLKRELIAYETTQKCVIDKRDSDMMLSNYNPY